MGHHAGDGYVWIAGQRYRLRLTIGGLSLMTTRFGLSGPSGLASFFRELSEARLRELLTCLIHPQTLSIEAASAADLQNALGEICTLFEQAFVHEP